MKSIIAILSVLISSSAFAQVLNHTTNSRVRAGVGYFGENVHSGSRTTNTSQVHIDNVGITAKLEQLSGSFYRVSGKVSYIHDGQQVEHIFNDIGIFFNSSGKVLEGSEDGPYETYLYIKKNNKGEIVLFARIYNTSKLPDELVATSSNGVALPAPVAEKPEHTPSQFTMFKM